jgi:FkbM family methyltransferase
VSNVKATNEGKLAAEQPFAADPAEPAAIEGAGQTKDATTEKVDFLSDSVESAPNASHDERDAEVRLEVMALYDRLHSNQLQDGDIIHQEDVPVADLPWLIGNADWIRKIFEEKQGHQVQPDVVVFGGFRSNDGAILDIGAHWGYSAVALRESGTDCEILSFEPLAFNWPSLEELKSLDPDYDFVMCALTDVAGELHLYSPAVNGRIFSGLNSADGVSFTESQAEHIVGRLDEMVPDAQHFVVQLLETTVGAYRLDDMVLADFTHVKLNKIAAVKIDVEGHEINVLRGATRVFDRDRPFVMIEAGNRDPEVTAFFTERDYAYGERVDHKVVPMEGQSNADNGYWFAKEKEAQYIASGIIRDPSDTAVAAETGSTPVNDPSMLDDLSREEEQ